MLRIAKYDDFADLKRMALSFFYASPYAKLGVDDTRVEELIHVFMQSPRSEKIIFVEDDHGLHGMLAGVKETNLFNNHKMAGELVWWIDPEYRKAGLAEQMRKAYEYWANDTQFCTLVDVMGNLDTYYKRKGYDRRETTYMKVN